MKTIRFRRRPNSFRLGLKKGKQMSATTIERFEPQKYFGALQRAMQSDTDFCQRVNNHIRAISGHANVVAFINNGSSDEEKQQVLVECLVAFRNKDYSKLRSPAKEAQLTEAAKEIETQRRFEVEADDPPTPGPIDDMAEEEEEEHHTPPPAPPMPDASDPVQQAMLLLKQAIYQPKKAEIDETRVTQIVDTVISRVLKLELKEIEVRVNEANKGRLENFLTNTNEAFKKFGDDLKTEVQQMLGRATIEIRPLAGDTIEISRQHYKFPLLVACLNQRIPVCLVGPAGGSKSTVCAAAAKALSLPFGAINFGPTTTKTDLYGYKDATGHYHSTELVRTALNGGVFCGDELDRGHAGVATMLNMPLANRLLPLPDGTKPVHDDWIPVFCGNTYGTGANRQYVGANQLDAATLDRMVFIEFDYDEGLEAHILGVKGIKSPKFDLAEGGTVTTKEWLKRVQSARAAVASLGIRHLITPRASIYGAKLLAAGVGLTHVDTIVLWKGLDAESVNKVKSNIK